MLEKEKKRKRKCEWKKEFRNVKEIFVLDFVYIMSFRVNSYDIYCIFKNYFM